MRSWPRPRNEKEAGGSTGAIGCRHDRATRLPHLHRWAANAIPSWRGRPGPTSLTDNPAGANRPATPEIETRQIAVNGQLLQVAIKHGTGAQPPLLLFNGI